MFEIEYGQHGTKTRLKSQTWPLRPEKVCKIVLWNLHRRWALVCPSLWSSSNVGTMMRWQQKLRPKSKAKGSCLQSFGIHIGSMSSIDFQLVPKSTAHIRLRHSWPGPPGILSAREKTEWKTIGCVCGQLLGSQECDHRIVHENSGHGFDTTSTIFAGPGA
jgi:hypothetical protein